MKHFSVCINTLLVILILISIQGCNKEKDSLPAPGFYEFGITAGDGVIYLRWHFPGLRNFENGVEVTYYLDGVRKVQRVFGTNTMTISGLTNGETYELKIVGYDKNGNKNTGFSKTVIPNTPFVIVSPTGYKGYRIEDGKVRIDLRFNRAADPNYIRSPNNMSSFINLSTGSTVVPYTYTWLDDNFVLSILTTKTKDTFCTGFPCTLRLRFHFSGYSDMYLFGIADTNGMQLDADNDGLEYGEGSLFYILE